MKYIDAEKLKAHIQHLIKKDKYELFDVPELLSFIDSLQQEQPEVDLDELINDFLLNNSEFLVESNSKVVVQKLARHFYELGFNARKKE